MVNVVDLNESEDKLAKALKILKQYKSVKGYKVEGDRITQIMFADNTSQKTIDEVKQLIDEVYQEVV